MSIIAPYSCLQQQALITVYIFYNSYLNVMKMILYAHLMCNLVCEVSIIVDREFPGKSVCQVRQEVHDDNCEWESSLCFAFYRLLHSNTYMNKLMGKSSLLVFQECWRKTRVRNIWITWYRYVLLFCPFTECLVVQIYKISYAVNIFFLYHQNDPPGCNCDAEEEFQATFVGIISLGNIERNDAISESLCQSCTR